jgi:hypothetical protein
LEKAFHSQLDLLESFKGVANIPTHLGLEIEVENIFKPLPLPSFWQSKIDGSLREGGMEFVSSPLPPNQAMIATLLLWLVMKKLIPSHKPEFSWRTSNHIHLNVLELEEKELRQLLLLAWLVEPLLFSFAGQDREDGVFCVPLSQCQSFQKLSKYFQKKQTLLETAATWPKYTAVNLCRMYSYPYHPTSDGPVPGVLPALGTIEFRHLGGSESPLPLLTWITIILKLFEASIALNDLEKEIPSLTPQTYKELLKKVFPPEILRCFKIPDESVLLMFLARTKELFLEPPKLKTISQKSALALYSNKMMRDHDKAMKAAKTAIKKKSISLSAGLAGNFIATSIFDEGAF